MSTHAKQVFWISLGVLLLCVGCAGLPPVSVPPSPREPKPSAPVASLYRTETIKTPAPRARAAMQLTEQARLLIASRKPDEAIRTLEKALNIDPQNGQSYYLMTEAWLMKGDRRQAMAFNRLAETYLDRDAAWITKVQRQKQRIGNNF